MAREILSPRWGNDAKTQIIAKFRYDDGRAMDASISVPEGGSNPDWDEIISTFGVEYLDTETTRALNIHRKRKFNAENQRKLNMERAEKEALFNAKAEAFDIDLVKNSTNREVKNKIRRASTIMQVMIYTTMLHMLEDPIANPVNDTIDDTSTSANT
jgi:hypothetical protein